MSTSEQKQVIHVTKHWDIYTYKKLIENSMSTSEQKQEIHAVKQYKFQNSMSHKKHSSSSTMSIQKTAILLYPLKMTKSRISCLQYTKKGNFYAHKNSWKREFHVYKWPKKTKIPCPQVYINKNSVTRNETKNFKVKVSLCEKQDVISFYFYIWSHLIREVKLTELDFIIHYYCVAQQNARYFRFVSERNQM